MVVDREVGHFCSDFYLFTVMVKLLALVIRIIRVNIILIESVLEEYESIH